MNILHAPYDTLEILPEVSRIFVINKFIIRGIDLIILSISFQSFDFIFTRGHTLAKFPTKTVLIYDAINKLSVFIFLV